MSNCKNCQAPIFWAKSAKSGKAMPMNAEPGESGKFVLEATDEHDRNGDPIQSAIYVHENDPTQEPRYICHFDDCSADDRPKKNGNGAQSGSTRPPSQPAQEENAAAYSPAAQGIIKAVETLQAMISRLAAKVDHLSAQTNADHRTMMAMVEDAGKAGAVFDAEPTKAEPQKKDAPRRNPAPEDDEVPFL